MSDSDEIERTSELDSGDIEMTSESDNGEESTTSDKSGPSLDGMDHTFKMLATCSPVVRKSIILKSNAKVLRLLSEVAYNLLMGIISIDDDKLKQKLKLKASALENLALCESKFERLSLLTKKSFGPLIKILAELTLKISI